MYCSRQLKRNPGKHNDHAYLFVGFTAREGEFRFQVFFEFLIFLIFGSLLVSLNDLKIFLGFITG